MFVATRKDAKFCSNACRQKAHRKDAYGALEKAGVEFIDENGGGLGVRLKPKKTKRKSK